jgi:hypothetical protein
MTKQGPQAHDFSCGRDVKYPRIAPDRARRLFGVRVLAG